MPEARGGAGNSMLEPAAAAGVEAVAMTITPTDYEKPGVFFLGREYDPAAAAPVDELVLYDSKDLVTHGVVLGMTGSGKTGLCVALLEEAAEAAGVDTARAKLRVFVLSAVYAAVAGVLLTHYNGGIGPSEASVMKSVRYVALVAVGGMTNLWGTLLMGVGLTFLSLRGVFGAYDDAVFGLILIAVMLFAPEGILSLRRLLHRRLPGGQA